MSRSVSLILISVASAALLLVISITNGLLNPQFTVATVKTITVQVPVVGTPQQKVEAFVNELMTKRQANCLLWILKKESHINPKAKNKKSSAKGIGQLLDSTYRNIGLKHSADPTAQVVAVIAYLSRHYSGSACSAKAFWLKHSYY